MKRTFRFRRKCRNYYFLKRIFLRQKKIVKINEIFKYVLYTKFES